MTQFKSTQRNSGLLASEICTRGGIQSFMLRVTEGLGAMMRADVVSQGYCISLNDDTETLRRHAKIPSEMKVYGAHRSKGRLIAHTLLSLPIIDVLFVGHIGLAPVALVLKYLRRIRSYYVILHGIEAWQPLTTIQRRALLGAKGIIATTQFTVEECRKYNNIPATHFHIIPLCADERHVNPSPIFKLNGEFKLLCVARQDASERYKGFEQMFHALALLKLNHPEVHLNLVGQGDDQRRLKKVVNELGVEDKVTFWGTLSDEDLAAAYEDCDTFVMPSKKEGFGIVFLEAMRRGKPCIGGKHGGTPEVIEHEKTGFLVEYENVNELVTSIDNLITHDSLRHQIGQAGQVMIQAKFSKSSFQAAYTKMVQP